MGLYGKKYKIDDVNVKAFLALASAGLWLDASRQEADIPWTEVNWGTVLQLSREQALVGIVASAFDKDLGFELQEVLDKDQRKALAKTVYSIEQRNLKMDEFSSKLFSYLETSGLHPVLLKGQGIARSYPNPQRRSCGDIDILLEGEEYSSAKNLLKEKARKYMAEGLSEKQQQQMFIGNFIVELHGTMRVTLSKKIDSFLDGMMDRMFSSRSFSSFNSGLADIKIPSVQVHAVYVFCHILEHLFHSGIGLRQVCDLCRFLHVHRDEIDIEKLRSDIESLGLMDEWKAFAALMVNYLGMRAEEVPFYEKSGKWNRKAKRILAYILSTGNMGKNRDLSYRSKSPYLMKKAVSLWMIVRNASRIGTFFPKHAALISLKGIASGFRDLTDRK